MPVAVTETIFVVDYGQRYRRFPKLPTGDQRIPQSVATLRRRTRSTGAAVVVAVTPETRPLAMWFSGFLMLFQAH
jgi:hypothetical protein